MPHSHKAPRSGSLHEITPKSLSIRTLNYRRALPAIPADVVQRVRGEFFEMRGFSPTVQQAARLFQLTAEECRNILGSLVQEGFLKQTPDGRYRLPS